MKNLREEYRLKFAGEKGSNLAFSLQQTNSSIGKSVRIQIEDRGGGEMCKLQFSSSYDESDNFDESDKIMDRNTRGKIGQLVNYFLKYRVSQFKLLLQCAFMGFTRMQFSLCF